MPEQEKMWTALGAHQPVADRRGYGAVWARMCSERNVAAAYAAADAARDAGAAFAALYAARVMDPDYATRANEFAKQSIAYITKANRGEYA